MAIGCMNCSQHSNIGKINNTQRADLYKLTFSVFTYSTEAILCYGKHRGQLPILTSVKTMGLPSPHFKL